MTNKDNGAFIMSRSIFESEIWYKPPCYLKLWLYLIGKANHKDRKYNGFLVKRGQYFCTYKELTGQLSYNVGYRKEIPHEGLTKRVMKYLRSTLMIDTTKEPRGVLVTILRYDEYQDLSNYERTSEETNERTTKELRTNQCRPSINKNVKNDKNDKKDIYTSKFLEFYNSYPKKIGKKAAFRAYSKVKSEHDSIIKGLKVHKFSDDSQFIPHPATWLNQGRWEDEAEEVKKQPTGEEMLEAMRNKTTNPIF